MWQKIIKSQDMINTGKSFNPIQFLQVGCTSGSELPSSQRN